MRCWLPCSALILAACSAGAPGSGIDTARAMQHVAELVAIGPRPGDSPAAQRAAAYIEQALATAGLHVEREAVGTVEVPQIEVAGLRYRAARQVTTSDPDLVVRLGPQTGPALLVMAHYDTVPPSPGAVDNGAAVGVLIELARVLAASPPHTPVILAFTANEEIGLVGAEALAEHHRTDVGFAIALDLIGGSGALSLNGASELIGDAELHWLADAANRAGVILRGPLAHRVISRRWPQIERSDHGAFTRRGVRAVHLYDRGQDGEWIDLAYHSPHDTLDRVDRTSVDEIGRLLVALAAGPLPEHAGDGFWVPVVVNTVIPRWVIVALDVALAALALGMLVASRRAHERGGLGLVAGTGCFVAATALTAVIERLFAGEHPAPWLHAPLVAELAELAVLVGSFGVLVQIARRFAPWSGDRRYLAVATVLPLLGGLAWLWFGAPELAWIWLLPAALCAVAPRLGRFGIVAAVVGALPGLLVLAPNQLREAAWNGFLPLGVPLAVWLGVFALGPIATICWWVRRNPTPSVLGTLVLRVGCVLAMLAGVLLLFRAPVACSASKFHERLLACDAPWAVHPGLH